MIFIPEEPQIHSRAQFLAAVARKLGLLPSPFPSLVVISIVLPDLPAFRQTYGEEAAAHIITRACADLAEFVPESIIGQFGDGRILLSYDYDPEWTDLVDVATDLHEVIDRPRSGNHISLSATSASGAASHSGSVARGTALDLAAELLRQADLAADLAVKQTDGRFCFYSAVQDARIRNTTILEQHLRLAVARKEFLLHYQPTVDLRTMEVVALEALVRWQSPRGLRSPDDFIPAAEANGMIVQIGTEVVDLAVRQIRNWMDEGWAPVKVAVNVSAAQLMDRDFPDMVSRTLERDRIDPAQFELEVTERTLIADPAQTRALLQDLRDRGVSVALDDFGVGYSSLQYLRDLPISKIKIDRSFVKSVADDRRDVALVRMVIGLGEALGLEVVAEGIETTAQLTALLDCGCHLGQGFLFSKARPPAQVRSLQDHVRLVR